MMDRSERIRQRIKLTTREEKVQEIFEEAMKRSYRMATHAMRMARIEPEVVQAAISERLVDFCAKHDMAVEDVTAKVQVVEAARIEKIKIEEEKLKGGVVNDIG